MKPKIRVGGVDENINAPWRLAFEEGRFDTAGLDVSWQVFGGGTGAMMRALDAGEIDVAVALTEGSLAHAARSGTVRVFGLYSKSPLVWGVHVHAGSTFQSIDELEGARFAISRPGSGSHVMAIVEAHRRGWDVDALTFVEVGDLEGALSALSSGEADAFMWEKYTTKPVVDRGEWRRVGDVETPWPSFAFVSRPDFLKANADALTRMVAVLRERAARLDQEASFATTFIAERYGLLVEDVEEWFADTSWACALSIDESVVESVVTALVDAGVLDAPVRASELTQTI